MEDETKNEPNETSEIDKVKAQRPSEERGSTEASRPNVEEEYLNNWKRERADFLNYKKDESRRMEEFVRYANEDLILELIDILDNMELGLKHEPTELLKKLSKDFEELLKKYGVEKIKTEGESFDPVLHEAVESSEVPEARLMEEVRPGYTMHGKVVRPARVKLIK